MLANGRVYRRQVAIMLLHSCLFLKFIYLFILAVLVFAAVWAVSSCSKQGLLFVVCDSSSLSWLLSLRSMSSRQTGSGSCSTQVLELQGFSNQGTWTQVLLGMWDLPRPGIESASPAPASIISTTGPPGKSTPVYLGKCGKMQGIMPRNI